MNKKKILSVKDIEVKFKVRNKILTAIRGVSFDLYEKEILAIVGESGSGKSVVTKTFTGMLEGNGWISNGSIVYVPLSSKNSVVPTDLVNTQRQLTDKITKKFIIKNCKRKIKALEKQKNEIINISNNNKLALITEKQITMMQSELKTLKDKNIFKNNWYINLKISKLEKKLSVHKYFLNLKQTDFKSKELKVIESELSNIKSDYSQFKKISWLEKIYINLIINILKKKIRNKSEFSKFEVYFVERKLNKENINAKIILDLKKIYLHLKNKNFNYEIEFLNIINDWKKMKSFYFLNKSKATKEITKIRGKAIATIFQDPMTSLNPLLSVGFQISEVLRKHHNMSKNDAKKEAIYLLGKVGIAEPEKRYKDIPSMYSGGMRQRVVIAIALACRPKILICDEPTTALDVTIQAQILELIRELQNEYNFAIIFITHDLGVVASIATRILVMYSGQVIESGTAEEIFYDARHPYTWALLLSLPQLGKKGKDLYSIEGTPPSLFAKISGDSFAPRNKFALKIDYLYEPPTFKVSETHLVKSWLLDERAPKLEKPKELWNLHSFIKNNERHDLNNE